MKRTSILSAIAISAIIVPQSAISGGLAPKIEESPVVLPDGVTGFAPVATLSLTTVAPLALGLGALAAIVSQDSGSSNGTNGTNGTN